MHIHPDIAALRGDDAPQRGAQAALIRVAGAWRKGRQVAEVLGDLHAFATCRSLAECGALSALFDEESDAAARLAGDFVSLFTAALSTQPLGHVPFRHFTDGTVSTLLLARSGAVTLSLVATDGDGLAARPDPVTVDFSPSEVWERVLAGNAVAELVECRPVDARHGPDREAQLHRKPIVLAPGRIICRAASRQALLLRTVEGRLVTLRLQRRRPEAGPTREYRLDDGRLVHQATGTPQESRTELVMALVARMGRADAAPHIAAIAQAEDGAAGLRWQALRECLALDTASGFAALSTIARRTGDPLAAAAGALRSQLVETHPVLEELVSCPA